MVTSKDGGRQWNTSIKVSSCSNRMKDIQGIYMGSHGDKVLRYHGKLIKQGCIEGITSYHQLQVGWDADALDFNCNCIQDPLQNASFTTLVSLFKYLIFKLYSNTIYMHAECHPIPPAV
jgi:hypothetical protein